MSLAHTLSSSVSSCFPLSFYISPSLTSLVSLCVSPCSLPGAQWGFRPPLLPDSPTSFHPVPFSQPPSHSPLSSLSLSPLFALPASWSQKITPSQHTHTHSLTHYTFTEWSSNPSAASSTTSNPYAWRVGGLAVIPALFLPRHSFSFLFFSSIIFSILHACPASHW